MQITLAQQVADLNTLSYTIFTNGTVSCTNFVSLSVRHHFERKVRESAAENKQWSHEERI